MHWLKEGERLDDLIINSYKIIQPEQGFRFSIDSVLLAYFAKIKPMSRVVDLGTGTGVIAMLLAARGVTKIEAIEIDEKMANLAERNFKLNGLQNTIGIHHADFRCISGRLPAGYFDLIVANPPYRRLGHGFLNRDAKNASARHELTAGLQDVFVAAKHLVKYRGRVAIVHLPERLTDILAGMREYEIEPKRIRFVQSRSETKPVIVLVEGIRGAKSGLEILPPLIIYTQTGEYNEEIQRWYEEKNVSR